MRHVACFLWGRNLVFKYYLHEFKKNSNVDNGLNTADSDWQVRSNFSSERAPHRDNTATFRQEVISDHKFQSGLDTEIYWLTDCHS
jgi:hypothetical protein